MSAPDVFVPCSTGSGIFGTWILDDLGLPAYEYGLDQNADARASWRNSEGKDRRDHWAPFGNRRINAMSFNDGYVEVTTQDRGPTYLNKFDESTLSYAGGFSYLDDGVETWPTAYKWRPQGAVAHRQFGMGYARASMLYRDIYLERYTFAPAGDAPAVLDEITLENRSSQPRTLKHYEYWDVARRPIEINWMVSGTPLAGAPSAATQRREERNAMFTERVAYEQATSTVSLRRQHAAGLEAPDPSTPNDIDYYPGDPFLAAAIGPVADVYTEQSSFFGDGDVSIPQAVRERRAGQGATSGTKGATANGWGQPRMFVLRSDLTLAPGETARLRFVYGYAPMGQPFPVDPAWSDPARDFRAEQAQELRTHLVYFASQDAPYLQRELAWDSYLLEASVGWREYWQQHVVPQGSAYLYLHGADGVGRDLALFSIALAYMDPPLAREELSMMMKMARGSTHQFAYSFQGNGQLDDALGLYSESTDQDIFFLWALAEYLAASGDSSFLDQPMSYYPMDPATQITVWDHVRDAVRHLFDAVGTGPHGLIRLGTGDWSDGIVLEARNRDLAVTLGESVPNTQMAVAVLPAVADMIAPRDAALAAEIRSRVDGFKAALPQAWTGDFYGRAYFGDGILVYGDVINLESQVWALIADVWANPDDRTRLVSAIQSRLDQPSPIGAMMVPGGQVWPAISGLQTWGYANSGSPAAWPHLARNTLAAHALAFPAIWYGIWSGPDGLNSTFGDRPGQTWMSEYTPMTDFPIMNNNGPAMTILAALRSGGAPPAPGRTCHLPSGVGPVAIKTAVLSCRTP